MEVDVILEAQESFTTSERKRNDNLITLPQECVAFFIVNFMFSAGCG